MGFDTITLLSVSSFMAGLAAILLASTWTQMRTAPALLWWAAAFAVSCAGVGALAAGLNTMTMPAVAFGTALAAAGPVLIWAGVRRFEHRRLPLFFIGLWIAVVVGSGLVPVDGTQRQAMAVFSFANRVVFLCAAAWELWRGRREPLKARWPLCGLLLFHAFTFVGGIYDTLFRDMTTTAGPPPIISWFGALYFEALIYTMGVAVFLVVMCKERSERRYIVAANRDSLTGIASRGALLEGGERLLQRCRTEGQSFSLIMLDLDRFKRVNDTFGHAVGDQVIRLFADTTRTILRPTDLFGRYGGEEFIVILPNATIEAAYVIADRIRHGFTTVTVMAGDTPVLTTVSAGVASATSAALTLEAIILAADRCLYRAKDLGRNRVERPSQEAEGAAESRVIRIA